MYNNIEKGNIKMATVQFILAFSFLNLRLDRSQKQMVVNIIEATNAIATFTTSKIPEFAEGS